MRDLDEPAKTEHPRPSHIPDVEYEDEPPGSYLGEFRLGWWKLAWSALNVLLVVVLVYGAEGSGESAPLLTAWAILPASCILSLCVTLWLSIGSRLEDGRFRVLACLLLDVISLVLRLFVCRDFS